MGWINSETDACFQVLIQSLQGFFENKKSCFFIIAGAGILPESNPHQEWQLLGSEALPRKS